MSKPVVLTRKSGCLGFPSREKWMSWIPHHVVYDSFGNIVTESSPSSGDRFKFAGMEFDNTTGQDYDRARYYSAQLGRFSSTDPVGFLGGSTNLFAYVHASPWDAIDASGLMASSGGSPPQPWGPQQQPVEPPPKPPQTPANSW